jgi:hypothetical protein
MNVEITGPMPTVKFPRRKSQGVCNSGQQGWILILPVTAVFVLSHPFLQQ